MSRQIAMPSGDIPDHGDNVSGLKEDGDLLGNRP